MDNPELEEGYPDSTLQTTGGLLGSRTWGCGGGGGEWSVGLGFRALPPAKPTFTRRHTEQPPTVGISLVSPDKPGRRMLSYPG